jgi:hypothetical protein
MINALKRIFGKADVEVSPLPVDVTAEVVKTAKDLATEANEPYINITSVDLDPDNIGNGSFSLDWNDKFVTNLVRAGYQGKTDQQLVDQWFQQICRNILAENLEQEWADPDRRQTNVRDIGLGRSEIT